MVDKKIEHCMCPACKDDVIHWSDCAVHNEPAYPNGECDCGVKSPPDTDPPDQS